MRYKCKLHIEYEVVIPALNREAAEIQAFETFGEAVTQGEIPMDLFKTPPGVQPIPMLVGVELAPLIKEHASDKGNRALIRRIINTVRHAKGLPLLAPPPERTSPGSGATEK